MTTADRLELSNLGEMWILTSDETRQHNLTQGITHQ